MAGSSKTNAALLLWCLASSGCTDSEQAGAPQRSDAGAALAALEARARELEQAQAEAEAEKQRAAEEKLLAAGRAFINMFCDLTLEKLCAIERYEVYCDYTEAVAHWCNGDRSLTVWGNTCGGVTFAHGAGTRWHYDQAKQLIGAHLSADTNQFCFEYSVDAGQTCAVTEQKLDACSLRP